MADFVWSGDSKHVLSIEQSGSTANGAYLTYKIYPNTDYSFNAMGFAVKVDGSGVSPRWHVTTRISGGRAYGLKGTASGAIPGGVLGNCVATGRWGVFDTVFIPITRGNSKQASRTITVATYQSNNTNSQASGAMTINTSRVADPTVNKPTVSVTETELTIGANYTNPEAFYNNGKLIVDIYNGATFIAQAHLSSFTNSVSKVLAITDAMRGKKIKVYTRVTGNDGSVYDSTPTWLDIEDLRLVCFYKTDAGWQEIDKIYYQESEDVWVEISHAYFKDGNWSRLG